VFDLLFMWRTSKYPSFGSRMSPVVQTSKYPSFGRRMPFVAQTLMRYMFDVLNHASPCNASHLQRRLCRDNRVRNALSRASLLAATQCQEQFRYDPWNCSGVHRNISFSEGSKGTNCYIIQTSFIIWQLISLSDDRKYTHLVQCLHW
jgi:hypothetical protein